MSRERSFSGINVALPRRCRGGSVLALDIIDPNGRSCEMDPYGMEWRAPKDPRPMEVPSPEGAIFGPPFHPNVLIIGSPNVSGAATAELLPRLRHPLVVWDTAIGGECPSIAQGTLVILNLERLDRAEQRQLLDFTDASRRLVQIVSVATTDLFGLVERGEFLDALYYRLNTVRLHVT
jgi:Sigma-54 interaction domain